MVLVNLQQWHCCQNPSPSQKDKRLAYICNVLYLLSHKWQEQTKKKIKKIYRFLFSTPFFKSPCPYHWDDGIGGVLISIRYIKTVPSSSSVLLYGSQIYSKLLMSFWHPCTFLIPLAAWFISKPADCLYKNSHWLKWYLSMWAELIDCRPHHCWTQSSADYDAADFVFFQ